MQVTEVISSAIHKATAVGCLRKCFPSNGHKNVLVIDGDEAMQQSARQRAEKPRS